MPTARLFVAWKVPVEIATALGNRTALLRRSFESAGGDAKWDPVSRLHATLHFLGEVEESSVPRLGEALSRGVAGHHSFEVAFAGFGAFPVRGTPRVLFARVAKGAEALVALATSIQEALVSAGVPRPTRPFHPHVTVARVRRPASRDWRLPEAAQPSLETRVTEVTLVHSTLGRNGASHRDVASATLEPS